MGVMTAMNLDALLKRGCLPWSPSPSASDLDVWDEYEHPRVGTFISDGRTVLFLMLAGADSRISVWAYTCLTSQEAAGLATVEFDSTQHLRDAAEKLFMNRKVAFALADDLLIGPRWSVSDGDGTLQDMAITFLDHILDEARERGDPARMLRAKLAEVDVATADLVGALSGAGRRTGLNSISAQLTSGLPAAVGRLASITRYRCSAAS